MLTRCLVKKVRPRMLQRPAVRDKVQMRVHFNTLTSTG